MAACKSSGLRIAVANDRYRPLAAMRAPGAPPAVGFVVVAAILTTTIAVLMTATSAFAATPPTAVLSVSPSMATAPVTVVADGSGSTGGTYGLAKYTYRFGDGSAAVSGPHLTRASHTYPAAGTYTVTLTVVGSHGGSSDTGSTTRTVSVTGASADPELGGLMDRGTCTPAPDPYTAGCSRWPPDNCCAMSCKGRRR
jgi:hypothetical protein